LEAKNFRSEDAQQSRGRVIETARKLERAGLHLETDEANAVGEKSLEASEVVGVRKHEAELMNVKSG
jgi:hypothetical protein